MGAMGDAYTKPDTIKKKKNQQIFKRYKHWRFERRRKIKGGCVEVC